MRKLILFACPFAAALSAGVIAYFCLMLFVSVLVFEGKLSFDTVPLLLSVDVIISMAICCMVAGKVTQSNMLGVLIGGSCTVVFTVALFAFSEQMVEISWLVKNYICIFSGSLIGIMIGARHNKLGKTKAKRRKTTK